MASSTVSSRPGSSSRSGNSKRNAGLPDLVFGPHQPLAHCRRRHQERGGDPLRIQSQQHLQHQRRTNAALDGRMRAGEHQREPAVRDLRPPPARVQPLRKICSCAAAASPSRACRAASIVFRRATVSSHAFRVRRTAVHGPIRQRRSERLRQGILRGRHIPRARRQKGDQPAVAAARHRLRQRRACWSAVVHAPGS